MKMDAGKDVDPARVYQKGPEFLRKQMELESEVKGGISAVERLAATKPKYVKSQQVVNSNQQPVLCFGSASVSSNGSSNRSSNGSRKLLTGRNLPVSTGEAPSHPPELENVVRRSSSKKRPDSLLLYRQKCEVLKGSTNVRNRRNLTQKLLISSVDKNGPLPEARASSKERRAEGNDTGLRTPEGTPKGSSSNAQRSNATDQGPPNGVLKKPGHKRVAEVQRRSGKGVGRSHSDISSRYSKNFADFDAFFKYCGLDGEVIKSLGKENFSARSDELAIKTRSFSVSSSDGGFSRNSDDSDGLLEDELHESIRQGTSIIERNARIIKWLYSCKNAKESGKKFRELD